MQAGRHAVAAQVMHGKVDRALQVLEDRALVPVGEGDNLVQEGGIAGFGDVFVHSWEQPQCVVRAVMRMPGGFDVGFVLRLVLVARIVAVLDQRQAGAVMHLRAQHEADAFLGHFGIQVDDALDVLDGVAVTVAVALAAVNEARRAGPDEGGEALEGVPGVDHFIEVRVRRLDVQVAELAVPVADQGSFFRLDLRGGLAVGIHQAPGFGFALLPKQESDGLFFARGERQAGVQRAAGIAVEVQAVVQAAGGHACRSVETLSAQEALASAGIAADRCACEAEEAL